MSATRGRETWRREYANYARRVMFRAPQEPALAVLRAVRARRARRGAPAGLTVGADQRQPQEAVVLPIRLRPGGAPEMIPLAATAWPLAQGAPWTGTFVDPEDAFSAHRFSWTIQALAAHGTGALDAASGLFGAWHAQHPPAPPSDGWDSYSVAERLAAAVYLQGASIASARAAAFTEIIRDHAHFLVRHLELRGTSTNNHLINDARALYLAGAALGDGTLTVRARELLDFAVPAMFVDGFLREGSTHYHLLLHRTLVEVAVVSGLGGDRLFAERAAEWEARSAAAARFVNAGEPDMPLIGDLSPDFPPDFLAGWASLFDVSRPANPSSWPLAAGARAGYFRAAGPGFLLHAWVNPDGHVPAWSHAHADLGSFTLSWHGLPLLVDGGRQTYAPGPMSTFGRSVRSHNAVSIDGFEPCVTHGLNGYPELFRSDYVDAHPTASVSDGEAGVRFDVVHEGFGRLGSGMIAARRVTLSRDGVVVDDRIDGTGRHAVETFFHFAPEADVTRIAPGRWQIDLPGAPRLVFETDADAPLLRGAGAPQPMGWTSRRYGAAVPSSSLVFTRNVDLPLASRYVVRHG